MKCESTLLYSRSSDYIPKYKFIKQKQVDDITNIQNQEIKTISICRIYVPEYYDDKNKMKSTILIGGYYSRYGYFKDNIIVTPWNDGYLLVSNFNTLYTADRIFNLDKIQAMIIT